MPFLATLRQGADHAPVSQVHDFKIAAPPCELELWIPHVDPPPPPHALDEQLRGWTTGVSPYRTIRSEWQACDLESFFQQPLNQGPLCRFSLVTAHLNCQDQVPGEKLFEFVREFADAVARRGTLPARSNHAKIGIIRLPQDKISSSPSQGSDSRQLIGGLMSLFDIISDGSVQFGNAVHKCDFRLRTVHPRQCVMESLPSIDPAIDDPNVLQDFVCRHKCQVVERQTSFISAVTALLDHQIRLPVF